MLAVPQELRFGAWCVVDDDAIPATVKGELWFMAATTKAVASWLTRSGAQQVLDYLIQCHFPKKKFIILLHPAMATDAVITKRLIISGLTPAITKDDISKRLSSFGTVKATDGFGLVDGIGQPRKFGYVTIETTASKLGQCKLYAGVAVSVLFMLNRNSRHEPPQRIDVEGCKATFR